MTLNEHIEQNYRFIPSVTGFLLKDEEILLGLRTKVSNGFAQNIISGIGGKVGDQPEFKDETTDDAIIRELSEEILVTPVKLINAGTINFIFTGRLEWNQAVTIYKILEWEGTPTQTDVITPTWYNINALPKSEMWDDYSYWLSHVLADKIVSGYFLLGEDNKVVEHNLKLA